MDLFGIFRAAVSRCLLGLIFLSFLATAAYPLESEDAQIFITGFNAYQKKDYQAAVDNMSLVLQKYPDTPLRDMTIFWLARANYKAGNRQEAAKYMAKFFREYPDSPLKGTVEDELVQLANAYERGEKLPPPSPEIAATESKKEAEAKLAAEKSEAARKAEAERVAAGKAAAEKGKQDSAREKADADRLAAEKAAEERSARVRTALKEKAEAKRLAREKAEAGQGAAEKGATGPVTTKAPEPVAKAETPAPPAVAPTVPAERPQVEEPSEAKARLQRYAAEQAASIKAKLAEENAAREEDEAERLAKEKAAAENLAATKAAAQKVAEERAAEEKALAEKAARERAAAERIAAEKAAAEKAAESRAAAERKAAEKAERERQALARTLIEEPKPAVAPPSRETQPPSPVGKTKPVGKKAAGAKKDKRPAVSKSSALKEKAIAEYKDLIDRFPGTAAAASAAARLSELGVSYGAVPKTMAPVSAPGENAQVLTLEVGQFAGVDFTVQASGQPSEVTKRQKIPFEIVNQGNGPDSFYLESGFPAAFTPQFSAAERPDVPVNLTPTLAPGEKYQGVIAVTIPPGYVDGARIVYPVKAASQFSSEISQSRDISIAASAPLLRMVLKADKVQMLPGDKVSYRVALLNIGSSAARGITLRLNYPPQYEPVDYPAAGFKQEMKAALVVTGLQVNSGESRDFTAVFQLKDEALAQQELFLRGEVVNDDLRTRDSFISTPTFVQSVSDVTVKAASDRLVVIPGQTVSIPLIVTNAGNVREDFTIRAVIPEHLSYTFYHDLNRDGIRQANEPMINHVGPLAPREEAYVVLEVATPNAEKDGAEARLDVAFESESNRSRKGTAALRLLYSRPVVELAMNGRGGRLKPGEVSNVDLAVLNRGSNMAKMVELVSILPYPLELVASDPSSVAGKNSEYIWKFEELGPGEKRSISLSFRLKQGAAVGTNIQLKNVLKYQDQLGNRY